MKPQYEPKTLDQALGYMVEEAGEVLAAIGKSQRWGLDSFNPEIPVAQRETNADWLWRELHDLEGAYVRLAGFLRRAGYRDPAELERTD